MHMYSVIYHQLYHLSLAHAGWHSGTVQLHVSKSKLHRLQCVHNLHFRLFLPSLANHCTQTKRWRGDKASYYVHSLAVQHWKKWSVKYISVNEVMMNLFLSDSEWRDHSPVLYQGSVRVAEMARTETSRNNVKNQIEHERHDEVKWGNCWRYRCFTGEVLLVGYPVRQPGQSNRRINCKFLAKKICRDVWE
jgi:hypothetical protein